MKATTIMASTPWGMRWACYPRISAPAGPAGLHAELLGGQGIRGQDEGAKEGVALER